VWLDHWPDYDGVEYLHPSENMYWYGREIAQRSGDATLMLMLNHLSQTQKQTLMYRAIQLGIDDYSVVSTGAGWINNGGHASGRKWPILFAGVMLNDGPMHGIGANAPTSTSWRFGEDQQTFYVTQQDVDRQHYANNSTTPIPGYTQDQIGLPEWGIRHFDQPQYDSPSWTTNYRTCCTATAWVGSVLSARMLNQQAAWNHQALFDYQDRYMQIETGSGAWSDFSGQMWETYRPQY
jgi:hypothetical protein